MGIVIKRKCKSQRGFTLIELAIVMVIVGFLMSGIIAVYENYIINKRKAEFTATLNTVTSALAYYIQDEGLIPGATDDAATAGIHEGTDPVHFPCPSGPNIGPSAAGFGMEQRSTATGLCTATNGVRVVTNAAGERVYIGSVPVVTLSLPSKHMLDPYGHRLSYAVSESVSSSLPTPGALGGALAGGRNPLGSITVEVLDGTGAVAATRNNVPFILVGHGENGLGAQNVDGSIFRPCAGIGRDVQNCDNNATFVDADLFRSTALNNTEYDDTAVFSLRGIADKEDYWGFGTDTTDIRNLNPRRVAIGRADPGDPLVGDLNPRGQVDIMGERTLVVGRTNFTPVASGPTRTARHGTAQQALPASMNAGFVETPWLYTNGCIEGNGDKVGPYNAICMGPSNVVNSGGNINNLSIVTAGAPRIDILPNGFVGINTRVPVERLHVDGNIRARTFLHSSDLRLKKDIEDLDIKALNNILLMRIVTFNMKDGSNEHKKIGVIAQDLEKIYPELVYKDGQGFLSVDYIGLTGPIIKALQQLNADKDREIKKLNGDVEKLNDLVSDLDTRLKLLEGKNGEEKTSTPEEE